MRVPHSRPSVAAQAARARTPSSATWPSDTVVPLSVNCPDPLYTNTITVSISGGIACEKLPPGCTEKSMYCTGRTVCTTALVPAHSPAMIFAVTPGAGSITGIFAAGMSWYFGGIILWLFGRLIHICSARRGRRGV